MDYLNRYKAGECQAVWREMESFNEKIRVEPLFSEAMAVARETMRRVRFNVERLHERLIEVGYEFANPAAAIIAPDQDVSSKIEVLQEMTGTLPLSMIAWYEHVGSVDFEGYHVALGGHRDAREPLSDPLSVASIDEALAEDHPVNRDKHGNYWLFIALDIFHKADYSGGDNVVLRLPNETIDGKLEAGIPYSVGFVEYLRMSISCGGFAGFYPPDELNFRDEDYRQWWIQRHREMRIPTELIQRLTRDLLPF